MRSPLSIDLNCDLGESHTESGQRVELELLDTITSASIACGGHAGDEHTMSAIIRAALERNVAIGAHPGYADKPNFGRVSLALTESEIESICFEQISTLQSIARTHNTHIKHVKPHGALYHDAMKTPAIAAAISRAVMRIDSKLVLVGFPESPGISTWRSQGHSIALEAFADRIYEPDGSLRNRNLPGALITDPAAAAAQALKLARSSTLPQTLCIHSDTPNAPAIARAVRAHLIASGIPLFPMSS